MNQEEIEKRLLDFSKEELVEELKYLAVRSKQGAEYIAMLTSDKPIDLIKEKINKFKTFDEHVTWDRVSDFTLIMDILLMEMKII